jgi:hypothetical protein
MAEIVALTVGVPLAQRKELAAMIRKATPEEYHAAKRKAITDRWAAVRAARAAYSARTSDQGMAA